MFAFIAMAGLAYINFLPGVVNALAGDIGFSDVEAGQIVAANGYGGLIGTLFAAFIICKVPWKSLLLPLFALLAVMDFVTAWFENYHYLVIWRTVAGMIGGICVGTGFAILAKLNNPDRAFGSLLFLQFIIGSVVIFALPSLESYIDAHAVFYVMSVLVVLATFLLRFLPTPDKTKSDSKPGNKAKQSLLHIVLLLLAFTLYNSAANGAYAYIGLVGRNVGFSDADIATYISTTGLLGLLGALLPMFSSKRIGRLFWLIICISMSVTSAAMLCLTSFTADIYLIAMALLFFSWPAVQAYLLAVTAEIDASGRLATVAAAFSSVGLASGPLLASALLDHGDYSNVFSVLASLFFACVLLLYKPVYALEKAAKSTLLQSNLLIQKD